MKQWMLHCQSEPERGPRKKKKRRLAWREAARQLMQEQPRPELPRLELRARYSPTPQPQPQRHSQLQRLQT